MFESITSSMIPKGLKTPAAMGIPSRLYILAKRKFSLIRFTVFLERSRHATTSNKSFLISTTSAASAVKKTEFTGLNSKPNRLYTPATSVPLPMAIPTSAWARAGLSLTPSPTIATRAPASCSLWILATLCEGSTSA